MHILFIGTTIDPISGYGTMADFHCAGFFNKGIPFTLLLPRSAKRLPVPYAKRIYYILPDLPLSFNSFLGIAHIPFLFLNIRLPRMPFSAVHSLHDFPYAVIGYRIARARSIPFFFSALGTYSVAPFKKYIDRYLFMPAYRNAKRIFAISSFTKNAMQKATGHTRSVDVLYLPVGEPMRPKEQTISPVRLPQNARMIFAVGSFKERKGIEVLIRAMPYIIRSVPNAHLVVVAAGNKIPCRLLARDYGVTDRVHFIQNISANELFFLFEQSALFTLTPRYVNDEFEGYGLVYGEAGWHAKPVVASISGGVPEAVIHNVTGLLVTENDERKTADAIIAILTDDAFALRLGAGGYEFVRSRTISAYADFLIRVYKAYEKK